MNNVIPVQIRATRMFDGIYPQIDYATPGAAGLDLRACIDSPICLLRGSVSILIPTGIAINIKDPNYAAYILPRSGLGHKEGLVLGNGTGLIDSDYQGELFISAWARPHGNKPAPIIKPGDRLAQLVFAPVVRALFHWVNSFDSASERGEGGFGSTGKS